MSDVKFKEINDTPDEGMILYGFSGVAVLEGVELKKDIIDLFRQKEIGFRKAIKLMSVKGCCSFDEAFKTVRMIREDLKKSGSNYVMSKGYTYSIDRVFWAHPNDVPKDGRYFKLTLIDMKNIDIEKYSKNKAFDAESFIKDHVDPSLINNSKKRKVVESKIIDPDRKDDFGVDEWSSPSRSQNSK